MTGHVATIHNTLGALEIGLIISAMFYGMTCVQCYHFYMGGRNDRPGLKWTVAALWVLETMHIVLLVLWFYSISVTHFGNKTSYTNLDWVYCSAIIAHGIVGTVVQWFFSWRVWSLSRKLWLAIPPATVSVVRCCLAFFIAHLFGTIGEKEFHDHYQWAFIAAQALNTGTDIWNASALVLYLRTRRSSYKNTNEMLNRIMLFTLETGLVTAGLALTLCLSWAFMPYNEIWNGVLFVYTRINANAVLVALNARSMAAGKRQPASANSLSLPTMGYMGSSDGNTTKNGSAIVKEGIYVETETVHNKDYPLRVDSDV